MVTGVGVVDPNWLNGWKVSGNTGVDEKSNSHPILEKMNYLQTPFEVRYLEFDIESKDDWCQMWLDSNQLLNHF